MDKKNLAIITSEFPPNPGGIGNHAYNLAKGLAANGYEVIVVADYRSKNTQKEMQFDASQLFLVTRIPITNIRFLMYFKRVLKIVQIVRKSQIIIASGKFSLWIIALCSLFFNRKYIGIIHGTEVNFSNKILKKAIDLSLKRFSKVIAVSEYTKKLVEYLKLKKIEVIPNGYFVNKAEIGEIKNFTTYPNLATVGKVSERKGQHNVINALPSLVKLYPNIHYHIVGIDIEKEKLLLLAKELKVEKHITFYGIISEKKKYAILAATDVFAMLSENTSSGDVEGFGIALLEANFFGVPTIGSEKCGIEDAINNYKSGIIVNPKDSIQITKAIQQILLDKPSFERESNLWSEKFTWEVIIKKYKTAIEF